MNFSKLISTANELDNFYLNVEKTPESRPKATVTLSKFFARNM